MELLHTVAPRVALELVPVWISAEIEGKLCGNFLGSFMSVESNKTMWACVLYLFSLHFFRHSFLLYFTKVLLCDKLEIKKYVSFCTESR